MLVIDNEIEVSPSGNWITHYFPFELEVEDELISGVSKNKLENRQIWSVFIFDLSIDATELIIKWKSFKWQIRRIDLLVNKATEEHTKTLSRFRPQYSIDL